MIDMKGNYIELQLQRDPLKCHFHLFQVSVGPWVGACNTFSIANPTTRYRISASEGSRSQ